MPGVNFPKQSNPNKPFWIIYNAWRNHGQESGDTDWISEAAVEDEVRPVAEALEALGFPVEVYPISSVLDMAVRINGSEKPKLVFNLTEGFRGMASREMHVAALFELFDLPYTGNSAKTLAAAQDKILTKRLFVSQGIPTPAWTVYRGGIFPDTQALSFPLIAKPSREDASIGISSGGVFTAPEELKRAAVSLFDRYRQPVLIEEFIDGREINAAVLEDDGAACVLPLSEILFTGIPPGAPRITSYEAKWHTESALYRGTPALCPAAVDSGLRKKLEDMALAVFSLLEGKDYGRIDFRVDAAGNPYVLEYNPNPDISPGGGFVRALRAKGMDFKTFAGILVRNNYHE
jgi:D-alanine-D-alanine ligase